MPSGRESGWIAALRQPEHTGENRCRPCTVVNVVFAVVAGGVVAAVSVPLGVVAVIASLAIIYVRGYLVPGTPTLTRRYAPERLLGLFGKELDRRRRTDRGDDATQTEPRLAAPVGPEPWLGEVGALAPVEEDGARIEPEFQSALLDRVSSVEQVDLSDAVEAIFGAEAEARPVGSDLTAVVDDDRLVAWESPAALHVDVAVSTELRERTDEWVALDARDRLECLSTLRAYLERCPQCDGAIEVTETVRESCCRPTQRTVTAECTDCGAEMVELSDRSATRSVAG